MSLQEDKHSVKGEAVHIHLHVDHRVPAVAHRLWSEGRSTRLSDLTS